MTLEFTIALLFLAGPCAWSTLTSFSVFQCSYSVSMIGGSSRIRTHGPFRAFSFQDCCLKPCSAILPYFGSPSTDRTYDIFVNSEAQLPLCYRGIDWLQRVDSNHRSPAYETGGDGRTPLLCDIFGGGDKDRTCYILLAKQALSQMSYTPVCFTYRRRYRSGVFLS